MSRKIKLSVISILLITTMLCTFLILPVSATIEAEAKVLEKIDPVLLEKMETASPDEKILVSIWFNDIDKNSIIEKTQKQIQRSVLNSSIQNTELKLNDIKNYTYELKIPIDTIQKIINFERKNFMISYSENNQNNIDTILSIINQNMLYEQDKPEIIYVCKLAPNAHVKLTKEQIEKIIRLNFIDFVYAYDENECFDTHETEEYSSTQSSYTTTYSTVSYDLTNVSYMRDTLKLTGAGIKIGLLDSGYLYKGINNNEYTAEYFKNSNITKHNSTTNNTDSVHADRVASILVGKQKNYVGVVPDAELYYVERSIGVKQGIELLIETYNVNIINISTSIGNYNTYNDYSRWMDHIISNHHITVVMSSGNIVPADPTTGIYSANMAYNVITVGGLDDKNTLTSSDDTIYSASRYNYTDNFGYKPDLIAPATNISTPAMNNGIGTGTSFSAPIVTGAIAQLMQNHSVLLMRPDLVKAILIAGATSFIIYSDTDSTAPSLQKNCGAGVLDAYTSYCCMNGSSSPKYIYDELTDGNTQVTYSATTDYYCPDVLRIALVWNCNSNINGLHTTSASYTHELAKMKLTITSPDGTSIWTSYAERGNVQVVTIDVSDGPYGTFNVAIERMDQGVTDIEYSIAVSRCSYIY